MFGLFDNPLGIVTDPSQLRPLTEAELDALYLKNLSDMRPASPSTIAAYALMTQNYRYPEKPLDERFADFKVRLAAAIEKRKVSSS